MNDAHVSDKSFNQLITSCSLVLYISNLLAPIVIKLGILNGNVNNISLHVLV